VSLKALGTNAGLLEAPLRAVTLLGGPGPLLWSRTADALRIKPPAAWPNDAAVIFRISL